MKYRCIALRTQSFAQICVVPIIIFFVSQENIFQLNHTKLIAITSQNVSRIFTSKFKNRRGSATKKKKFFFSYWCRRRPLIVGVKN